MFQRSKCTSCSATQTGALLNVINQESCVFLLNNVWVTTDLDRQCTYDLVPFEEVFQADHGTSYDHPWRIFRASEHCRYVGREENMIHSRPNLGIIAESEFVDGCSHPEGYEVIGGKGYKYFNYSHFTTPSQGRAVCEAEGTHLAIFRTQEEYQIVQNYSSITSASRLPLDQIALLFCFLLQTFTPR